MTPEQMKYVKPIDPALTWHFLQQDQEQAGHYVSSLIKANKKTKKITGFQPRKTQATQKNIHQYRKRSYNYVT